MRRLTWLALMAVVAFTSSCATGKNYQDRPRTTVEVDNQSLSDMTIYVLRGSQRVRIGIASGLRKTALTIPQGIVFGATSLSFLADPIGGTATPVSQEITVSEGDTVILRIPPGR